MSTTSNINSNRKSYKQVCPVATALDYVGDRWTILILRELLGGSARFLELKDGLPGIPTNLLTDRLRRLEADELVRQIQQHNTVLYMLTEAGSAVRPFVEELGFWGAQVGRAAPAKYARSIRAFAMALQSILVRAGDKLPTDRFVVELAVDSDYVEIVLNQQPTATVRLPIAPDARVKTTSELLSQFLAGKSPGDKTFTHISGNEAATNHLITALS